jgi:hypothetical protein
MSVTVSTTAQLTNSLSTFDGYNMIVILQQHLKCGQRVLTCQQTAIKTLDEVSAAYFEMCAIQTSYNGAPSTTSLTLRVRECA